MGEKKFFAMLEGWVNSITPTSAQAHGETHKCVAQVLIAEMWLVKRRNLTFNIRIKEKDGLRLLIRPHKSTRKWERFETFST